MAFVLDKVSEDTFYENLLLGLPKVIDKNPRITNIHLERQQACCPSDVTSWEQQHGIKFPEDIKDFYLSTNGFKLTWSYVFSEQETLPVGILNINSLSNLILLSGHKFCSATDVKPKDSYHLHLNSESKIFQLTSVEETSQVCLVYVTARSSPTIWLADADSNWFFLSKTFTKYIRMGIAHLGLPLWQYCFSRNGVPSWVEQIFMMIAPHLSIAEPIKSAVEEESKSEVRESPNFNMNKLDLDIFKSKVRATYKSTELLKYRKKQ